MTATLYAARGGAATTSDLYALDPLTSADTSLGATGYAITGLAVDPTDPDSIYAATSANSAVSPRCLIKITLAAGVVDTVTLIGSFGAKTIPDIAFTSAGQLIGWSNSDNKICTIDKTNAVIVLLGASGISGTFGNGLGITSADAFYICPKGTDGDLYSGDLGTGALTALGVMDDSGLFGGAESVNAVSFAAGDVFWALYRQSRLATLDVSSRVWTAVGAGMGGAATWDALAWGAAPLPPPPPPAPPHPSTALPIRLFVTDRDSRTLTILDRRATDRQFLYTLNQPAYHTGQVASDDPEINLPFPDADSPANLTNNRRLIFALQRWQDSSPPYQAIFGGIVNNVEDQGADTPTTRYTAYDGWQYMMSRPVRDPDTGNLPGPNGLTFPSGSRASDIALGLLQITEIEDGETHIDWSDSGLIATSDPLPSAITFDAGLSVGEAWQQLCDTGTIDIHLDPMYEPIDAPGKINRFRVVAQSAGTAAGPVRYDIIMGWDKGGRSLMGVSRLVDGTRLANRVQFFAGQGGTAAPLQSDAASIAANGEYWAQQFFPGSNDVTIVALLAVTELLIRRNGARSIALDPAPERVETPLRDWGLGDYLPVWASRNLREPLGIDYDAFDANNPGASGYHRVYAIPLAVDDNGVARVTGVLTSKEN